MEAGAFGFLAAKSGHPLLPIATGRQSGVSMGRYA